MTWLLDGFVVNVSRDHEIKVLSLPRLFASGGTRAWIQSGVARGFGLDVTCQFPKDELLKDVVHSVPRNAEEAVGEGEGSPLAVRGGVVEVGDGTSGHIARNGGKCWLAMTVVSATDEDGEERVADARTG